MTLSKDKITEYNKKNNRKEAFANMLRETANAIDNGQSVLACDTCDMDIVNLAKIICLESQMRVTENYDDLWRLNHTCAKLRHHLSRLTSKTWATTKNWRFLQM